MFSKKKKTEDQPKRRFVINRYLAPYVISCKNTTRKVQTCVVFGLNMYALKDNFGSNVGVKIESLTGSSYHHLLFQSSNKPFRLGKIRVQSVNPKNLQQSISIHSDDASGQKYTQPMWLGQYMSAYQNHAQLLDVNRKIMVDANTFFTFTLQPHSEMVLDMYPITIWNMLGKFISGVIRKERFPTVIRTTSNFLNVQPVKLTRWQKIKSVFGWELKVEPKKDFSWDDDNYVSPEFP